MSFNLMGALGLGPSDKAVQLCVAAACGDLATLKKMLGGKESARNVQVDARGPGGGTALIRAVEHGHIECASFILEKFADVDLQLPSGETALHRAVAINNLALVQLLATKGACDLSKTDSTGRTAKDISEEMQPPHCCTNAAHDEVELCKYHEQTEAILSFLTSAEKEK